MKSMTAALAAVAGLAACATQQGTPSMASAGEETCYRPAYQTSRYNHPDLNRTRTVAGAHPSVASYPYDRAQDERAIAEPKTEGRVCMTKQQALAQYNANRDVWRSIDTRRQRQAVEDSRYPTSSEPASGG